MLCHDVSMSGEQGHSVLKVVLFLWNSDKVEGAMYVPLMPMTAFVADFCASRLRTVGMVPPTYLHGILGDDICAAAIYRHPASVVLL